jgi:putative peptide maturation dehydrogenase
MPDISALLMGTLSIEQHTRINLLCPISGERISLSSTELALVASIGPGSWHDKTAVIQNGNLDADAIDSLIERRILVSDGDSPSEAALRDGETRLEAIGWHPLAAVYHGMTRWQGVIGDEGSREHNDAAQQARLTAHAGEHGPLAPHFPQSEDAFSHLELPVEPFDDAFARVLRARRTTRHFDSKQPLALHELSRLLYGTFGALGTQELAPGMVAIKRTSASGGALHPIEAYPLVINVAGLVPGFYHYESGNHALALLKSMTEADARALASVLTIGQTYFADAQALVFHVARLDRHHWKYRRHPKAYKAVLLDSGHLSQTFYLLAAERGLGAFYTAAINDTDVGAVLGLDPLVQITIGANGLGIIDSTQDTLHLQAQPWLPDR